MEIAEKYSLNMIRSIEVQKGMDNFREFKFSIIFNYKIHPLLMERKSF